MPEGSENVNIGEPIAIVVENKDDIPAFASVTKESLEGGATPAASTPAAEATPAAPTPAQPAQPAASTPAQPVQQAAEATPAPAGQNRVFISPLAKTILKNSGSTIDISTIKGTGPQGRIVAADVLAAVSSKAPATPVATPAATPAATSTVNYEDVPVTPMRKVISTRLSESKQTIPHYYVNQNCYVDELLKVLLLSLLHS